MTLSSIARVTSIVTCVAVAEYVADTLTSDAPPSCAPSRTAQMTSRRPEWLAATFDTVGMTATERVGIWPWQKHRPTALFEEVRTTLAPIIMVVLAAFGVKGVFSMSNWGIKCLVGIQVATATASATALAGIMYFEASLDHDDSVFGHLALLVLTLAAAVA